MFLPTQEFIEALQLTGRVSQAKLRDELKTLAWQARRDRRER